MNFYELLMNYYRKETQDKKFEEKYASITMNRDKFVASLEDQGVTEDDICQDIMSNMKNEYKAHQFKKRFKTYFGKEKALSTFIMNELIFRIVVVMIILIISVPLLVLVYYQHELMSKSILITLTAVFLLIAFQQTLAFAYKSIAILKYPNIYGILFGWKADKTFASNTQLMLIKRKRSNSLGSYAPAYYDFKYENGRFQLQHQQELTLYNNDLEGVTRYTLGTEEHCLTTLHHLVRQDRISKFNILNSEFETAKLVVKDDNIKI